jgi:hypothetical protein
MNAEQQVTQDRRTDTPRSSQRGDLSSATPPASPSVRERIGEGIEDVGRLGKEIAHNRPTQIGIGVAAAAGAGLLLVQAVGVGAAAVAGAAGYLVYRELSGKRTTGT